MLTDPAHPAHAVARLRATRLAASAKPFLARGSGGGRCPACRLIASHCLCALRPVLATHAGFCLLMGDIEALKPSNTGWLVADLVSDTWAFGWSRTAVHPDLLTLLADPQWQAHLVFPGEFADPARVVTELLSAPLADAEDADQIAGALVTTALAKRPLFVLLDGTWSEARKMFRKSPYLDRLPVLSLQPGTASNYRLRRSSRADHFCTAEVAAQCLALAGETQAADILAAYLDVFTTHYLSAKRNLPLDRECESHQRLLRALYSRGSVPPIRQEA